ncbi:hypothetical protein D3C72_2599050 [compost metagenome]
MSDAAETCLDGLQVARGVQHHVVAVPASQFGNPGVGIGIGDDGRDTAKHGRRRS